MKRFALALIAGVVFVFGYVAAIALIYICNVISESAAEFLGLPVTFGYYLYKYFGGSDTPGFVERNPVFFFATISSAPILLYSLFVYAMLSLYAKFLRPKQEFVVPPLPPKKFD